MISRLRVGLAVAACVLLSGCSASNRPKLAAADGTVKFQGKPLAGATVMFMPEKGPIAMGITDLNGKFTMSTGTYRGVVPGSAKATVTVAAPGQQSPDSQELSKRPQSQAEADAFLKKAGEMQQSIATGTAPPPKSPIPEKYSNAETSGLVFTIQENGDNHFDIDLQ